MKIALFCGASALALAAGLVRHTTEQPAARPDATLKDGGGHSEVDVAGATRNFLIYFVVPLWIAAGVADWLCHRASDIEHTGGPEESLIHLLMLAEVGMPSLAGLFLEITSPVFGLMIAAFLLHQATALWDIAYAVSIREVTPVEQQVHSFLELLPLMAIAFLAVLHKREFLDLFGLAAGPVERSLKPKREPLPAPLLATIIAAIALFNGLPYLEELWRGLRARFSGCDTPRAVTGARSKSPTTDTLANLAPASAAISAGS
jgi:hypothetical protein